MMGARGAFTFAEDVDGTPGGSGPGWGSGCKGPQASFSVYCDDKENVDPRFGPTSRFARAAALPLTPGAAAAAARDAATSTPQGPAAEDPKSRDGGGGAHTPRRAALSDITQYVPAPPDDGKKLRARSFVQGLGSSTADACAAAGHTGAMEVHRALRPVSTSLRHSMR